jgi:hypothetical protein
MAPNRSSLRDTGRYSRSSFQPRDHHSLDDDVKIFFVLSNAIFDAGIAAWDMKCAYDAVRPITAIPLLFKRREDSSVGLARKRSVSPYPTIRPSRCDVCNHFSVRSSHDDSLGSWLRRKNVF